MCDYGYVLSKTRWCVKKSSLKAKGVHLLEEDDVGWNHVEIGGACIAAFLTTMAGLYFVRRVKSTKTEPLLS